MLYVDDVSLISPMVELSDNSNSNNAIAIQWSHSDECFENCTFMYEVTWQQSGDGSSLGNTTTTETSYTVEGLTSGTSYEIGVGAYCREDPSIRSEEVIISTKLPVLYTNSGMYIEYHDKT